MLDEKKIKFFAHEAPDTLTIQNDFTHTLLK
jgi:hypothetical protein